MGKTKSNTLKKPSLYESHLSLGAKMMPFGGWEMPIVYSGIVDEHLAVRNQAGIFDVSHMGEIEMAGKDALAAIQKICSNDASKLSVGQAQYSALTTDKGTFVDDLLVYRLAFEHFLLVVNAANTDKDYKWITDQIASAGDVTAVNSSARYCLLAVQGPSALEVVQTLTSIELSSVKYYWFATGEVANVRATISRTGYTGEDGVEIFIAPSGAGKVWDAVLKAGKSFGLLPVGLGARDTLRLEAGMRLHGVDIDETTTILEADLGWIVGWKKSFLGSDLLNKQKANGVSKRLIGFEVIDRGIARHGYGIYINNSQIGSVSSGTQTPFLKKSIGMAYLPDELTNPGREFDIDIRGKLSRARVVPLPFYKRSRSKPNESIRF